LMFFTASMIAGVLLTPRDEMVTELMDLLASIDPRYFFRAVLRCTAFLAILCTWCLLRTSTALKKGHEKTYIASNLLLEGLMIGFTLKLIWLLIVNSFSNTGFGP